MSDVQSYANPNGTTLSAGARVPFFNAGTSRPSPLSARDMNQLVKVCNLVLSMRVNVLSNPPAGTPPRFNISDQNIIFDFPDFSGTGGGGSVNVVACRTITETANYVTCQPITYSATGFTDASTPQINVAKPTSLRGLTGAQINSPYSASVIYALQNPTGGTGVFVAGNDVGYLDINIDARIAVALPEFKGIINAVSLNPDIYANYFIVSTATGLVRVAKSAKLRNSVLSETIDGNTWSYAYGAPSPYSYVARKATATIVGTGITEFQVIVPRFLPANEIWYVKVANSDIGNMVSVADTISATPGTPITFKDTNEDGRAWCYAVNQGGYE